MEDFTEEIDTKLFQVLDSNLSSLHPVYSAVVSSAAQPGRTKWQGLHDKYVPKWQSMQSENGKNPMNRVVETDKLYKSGFESFKNGKSPLEVTDNLHTFNTRVLQAYIEDPSNKSISDMVGGSAEVLQEVVGSDAYARLKQVTSIAGFKDEFNKRYQVQRQFKIVHVPGTFFCTFFLFVIWIVHLTAILFSISGFAARYYSKRDNMKGYFMYNLLASIALFPFLVSFFILSQLFVNSFAVRLFYLLFFIAVCIYVPIKGYRNAVKFVFDVKREHRFERWLTRKAIWLMAILTVIAGPYYLIKTLFSSAGDFEKNLMGALSVCFPLIAGLCLLFYLYMFNVILRSYYMYKYADAFRERFGLSEAAWYGSAELEPVEKNSDAEIEEEKTGEA